MKFKKYILFLILIAGSASAQNWQLAWSDEFDGSTLNTSVWGAVNAGTGFGNQELQYYSSRPQNLAVQNGNLVINALLETYKIQNYTWNYTSAKISTQGLKDFLYGKIEARIKLPGAGAGTWPAFWTLGYGGWPGCGELDICEFQGSMPDQYQSNIHTLNYNGTNGQNFHLVKPYTGISDDFHVWGIEWTPTTATAAGKVKFFLDGVQYWTFNSLSVGAADYPFTSPNYIILNLAIGGKMGGAVDNSIFPKQMLVDYVRYYQDASTGVEDVYSATQPNVKTLVTDKIAINFPDAVAGNKTISVFDVNGKMLVSATTSDATYSIDASAFTKGMYLVKTEAINKIFSNKVIKN